LSSPSHPNLGGLALGASFPLVLSLPWCTFPRAATHKPRQNNLFPAKTRGALLVHFWCKNSATLVQKGHSLMPRIRNYAESLNAFAAGAVRKTAWRNDMR
jgi:hypothetical protein